MKRIEQVYQKAVANKHRKLSNASNASSLKHIQWYETFNKLFTFVKMTIEAGRHPRFTIEFNTHPAIKEEFIITVEKGCFFVIEMKKLDSDMQRMFRSAH
jgi:hypothetical protein